MSSILIIYDLLFRLVMTLCNVNIQFFYSDRMSEIPFMFNEVMIMKMTIMMTTTTVASTTTTIVVVFVVVVAAVAAAAVAVLVVVVVYGIQ